MATIKKQISTAEKLSEQYGFKFTKLRKLIYEKIIKSKKPLKAYDILDGIKDSEYSAKPPTVYRTLDFLIGLGLIHKIESDNSYIACSHPNEHSQCFFMTCEKCGDTQEICADSIKSQIEDKTKNSQFKISNINLEVKGLCGKCNF
jgi:Fur family zinc uptake transcriptional regulator